jgi:predicted nucleic acid-binding protein
VKLLVADTSPLISLIILNKLELLFTICADVVIPDSVWAEMIQHPGINKYPDELSRLKLCIIPVKNRLLFPEVDQGEADAISLYIELKADVLLIDDKKGRQIAEQNQVNCVGTLGLLIAAKEKGLVSSLRPIFAELITNNRYYQKELLNKILLERNEQSL